MRDIYIEKDVESLKQGKDKVLNGALEYIKNGNKK